MLAALLCCARVLGVTQWLNEPYSFVIPTHIQGVGQSCTGSTALKLTHASPCMLSVSVHTLGNEVLTLGGPGGPTLTTSYKITGIPDQDTNWVSSSAFLSRNYAVPGNGVTDMTLWVQGAGPSNSAPDAGNYTATIVLTVTF
jgi:hypothetical protein